MASLPEPHRPPDFLPLSDRIAAHARCSPDGCALKWDKLDVTWRELDDMLNRIASRLAAAGVRRGDTVAAIGPNSPEYLALFLGALRAGACMVPLPTMAASNAIARMINDAGTAILFAVGPQCEMIDAVRNQLAGVAASGFIVFDAARPGWTEWGAWLSGASDAPFAVAVDPDDDFNIMYSSGTTGRPNGILHSHRMRNEHITRMRRFGVGPGTVTLISTPLYSNTTHACLLGSIGLGGTTILMRKFDALEYLKIAERNRVTHTILVPVQYQRILDHPDFDRFDLASFQWKICTSAPFAVRLKREAAARWPGRMLEIYGHSEGGANCTLDLHAFPHKLHTVGKPIEGCEIRFIDEHGVELPKGQAGEIIGRQPGMMKGYYKQPEKTAEVSWHDERGTLFYRSGDVGCLDEDGFLVLLDRTKDMILSGGFNVYAADIERVLLEHPAVAEVAVIAVPSEQWGETPLAVVVRKSGADTNAETLREFANACLGKLQRISEVRFRESLPRSEVGKVLKSALREAYGTAQRQPPG